MQVLQWPGNSGESGSQGQLHRTQMKEPSGLRQYLRRKAAASGSNHMQGLALALQRRAQPPIKSRKRGPGNRARTNDAH
eukprot:5530169-Alexandrium_andersonii.AAC.1